MRYFFNTPINKTADGYTLPVPFNVWEVCRQRDEIEGELVLDNNIISCTLVPVSDKGQYEIHVAPDAPVVDAGRPHDVLLHISGSIVTTDANSPYSFEHPIRHIDSMDVIIQPEDGLCGQACVAMLAGVTIADVIRVMDCRQWQGTMGRMVSALNYYGIDHTDIITYTQGADCVLPKCAILMERMGRFCHYLVTYDGRFYDPNLGVFDDYDVSKLLGYLEIKTQ